MITLEANYSKKLGLPGYSSHQFSVTIRTELSDFSQVQNETAKLYNVLQSNVDREIQNSGFLPSTQPQPHNGNGVGNGNGNKGSESWNCSDKQRDLILKVVEEHHLDKAEIESLAQARFGKGVRALNKLEASGLIDELLEKHGGQNSRRQNGRFQGAGR